MKELLSGDQSFFIQTKNYKIIPLHDCDNHDMQKYCDSMFACENTIEFIPTFKIYLDEVLDRFFCNWFVIRKEDYHCIGCIEFEKITETGLACFAMTIQPDEQWEEIFPPLIRFVFSYFQLGKIVTPRNNITAAVKLFYKRIGMKPTLETHTYQTQWGDVAMQVYCFNRTDFLPTILSTGKISN